MFDGCSAAISDHQLLIIGAYYSRKQVKKHSIGHNRLFDLKLDLIKPLIEHDWNKLQVSELNLLSLSWTSWPPLTKVIECYHFVTIELFVLQNISILYSLYWL